ncbi:PqqD family protein [Tessaracoccus sp. Y1736]
MTHRYHPDVVWEEDDDRVIATAPTIGEVVILDGTAALIWHCLDAATTDEIVGTVSEATGTEATEIHAPVAAYLADLTARRLAVSDE